MNKSFCKNDENPLRFTRTSCEFLDKNHQKEVTTTALLGELDKYMSGVQSFYELLIKYEEIHEDLRGGASEKAASEIFRLVSQV